MSLGGRRDTNRTGLGDSQLAGPESLSPIRVIAAFTCFPSHYCFVCLGHEGCP